ncbi:putative ribonuclease H-like domain-containing protein [Tanacetum coccineum]
MAYFSLCPHLIGVHSIPSGCKEVPYLYGTIDEEVHGLTTNWHVILDTLEKGLLGWSKLVSDCIKLKSLIVHGKLTFFLGLQVKQNKAGIFISQDKYVAKILKKFDLVNVKTAITPMETKVALTKDEEAVNVDVTSKTITSQCCERIFKYLKDLKHNQADNGDAIVKIDKEYAAEEELNEQQKKRRAQVQFEAQHYNNRRLGSLLEQKIEANAELKSGDMEAISAENLSFEEVKKIRQAELRTKQRQKRLKSDEAKDDEPTKKTGKRRKQMARKGLHTDLDKDDSKDTDEASEQDDSASAMLKDITEDDLTE